MPRGLWSRMALGSCCTCSLWLPHDGGVTSVKWWAVPGGDSAKGHPGKWVSLSSGGIQLRKVMNLRPENWFLPSNGNFRTVAQLQSSHGLGTSRVNSCYLQYLRGQEAGRGPETSLTAPILLCVCELGGFVSLCHVRSQFYQQTPHLAT